MFDLYKTLELNIQSNTSFDRIFNPSYIKDFKFLFYVFHPFVCLPSVFLIHVVLCNTHAFYVMYMYFLCLTHVSLTYDTCCILTKFFSFISRHCNPRIQQAIEVCENQLESQNRVVNFVQTDYPNYPAGKRTVIDITEDMNLQRAKDLH